MRKIRKAIIPAAGLGTRVLPATKVLPKEMFPIVDKPAIQYIVEEAVASGIKDILIIINRGKSIIEDHFDRAPELEQRLSDSEKTSLREQAIDISNLANIHFIRQKESKGLGHAVLCAKTFVGNEPFAVLYGDDVIVGKEPACAQLLRVFEEFEQIVVGIKKVPEEDIFKYSSLEVKHIKENVFKCTDMIEKPAENQIMSCYSIQGRCILTPNIFEILETTLPGKSGEIQLTDAIRTVAQKNGVIAAEYSGKRYDIGSKLGILKACVEMGLVHPEIKDEFKEYLKDLLKNW